MNKIIDALTGVITEDTDFVPIVLSTEDIAEEARELRSVYLQISDPWALADRTMTSEQTAYRQALRDIPSQAGFPANITWPTKPE